MWETGSFRESRTKPGPFLDLRQMDASDERNYKANKKVIYVDGWGGEGAGPGEGFLQLIPPKCSHQWSM